MRTVHTEMDYTPLEQAARQQESWADDNDTDLTSATRFVYGCGVGLAVSSVIWGIVILWASA